MRRTHIQAILLMVCMGIAICLVAKADAGLKKKYDTYTTATYTKTCDTKKGGDIEVSVEKIQTMTVGQAYNIFSVSIQPKTESPADTETTENHIADGSYATDKTVILEGIISSDQQTTECSIEEVSPASSNRWNISLNDDEIDLLARIVWVEARGECREGQIAVVEVIFNRVYSGGFPNTLYGVLSQKNQFESWEIRNTARNYESQVEVIKEVIAGNTNVLPVNVMYFAMSPLGNDIAAVIGNHYFTTDWQYPEDRKY